jgi:hypothetical protein
MKRNVRFCSPPLLRKILKSISGVRISLGTSVGSGQFVATLVYTHRFAT